MLRSVTRFRWIVKERVRIECSGERKRASAQRGRSGESLAEREEREAVMQVEEVRVGGEAERCVWDRQ